MTPPKNKAIWIKVQFGSSAKDHIEEILNLFSNNKYDSRYEYYSAVKDALKQIEDNPIKQ